MIRLPLLLLALALLQAPPPGAAADYYHSGARSFIDGDSATALAAVEAGLALAPGDPKLEALKDLIEQQQDQQDSDGGGEADDAEDQQGGDEGEPSDEAESDPSDGTEDESDAEADATQTGSQEAQAGDAPPQPDGRQPEAMTRAQAERILDAVGGEEELLLRELRRAPTQRSRSDKDW